MGLYSYQVRDPQGNAQSGTINAASIQEASQKLRASGNIIMDLADAKGNTKKEKTANATDSTPKSKPVAKGAGGRIKREDIIGFSHQISVMLQTGVSLSETMEAIASQMPNPAFQVVLREVQDDLSSGSSFSGALAKHPKIFPSLMISLFEASEATGTIGTMAERISQYLSKEYQTIKKIRGAMMYPIFMILMAGSVTTFLMMYVLPKFSTIYMSRGAELPLPTTILLTSSQILLDNWYWWLGGLITIIGGGIWFSKKPAGRRFLDYLKIKVPVISNVFNLMYLTRSTRTMGTMISAGVPMLDVVGLTKTVTKNVFFEELWSDVHERLSTGDQLSTVLVESDLIPSSISRMIYSGEKSGRLGWVLDIIADFTEKDFEEAIERMTQFIEPVLIVFMGSLIGFIAISLLLPIFSIGKVMAG